MDITKLLKGVKTLDDYLSITQDLEHKYKTLKIQFNMSSVLFLKKFRSLEIEYFNKCDGSGAAFLLFERMQSLPASKTWNLLGKEVVSLIQYWLDAVRKHLITHHPHWWSFLKNLLNFIKNVKLKDVALNNILVSETSESLLDLATNIRLNSEQKYEVLHTFNLFCAESTREIRKTMRPQLEHYFIKLSTIMATCSYVPTQFTVLEALLRWLQPRHDMTVRREAAAKWFPEDLYRRTTAQLFLERPWLNFYQDARDLLNSHNHTSDDIISVVCKKLSVGNVDLISGSERRRTWVDVNMADRCVTVVLEPRLLEALDAGRSCCSTLVISRDNAVVALLHRESVEITISVRTVAAPQLLPSEPNMFGAEDTRASIVVSSRSDLVSLDNALRAVFSGKYQVLLDFDNVPPTSPPLPDAFKRLTNVDEETRFSHPARELGRHKHSGYIVRPKNWQSPSSVSTSSLARLPYKLAALPHYKFEKERGSVCAQPELSSVSELNETDNALSLASDSTLKLRPFGCMSFKRKKSFSDTEVKSNKVRPKNWQSPSSVSTSSLARLPYKLAALPHYKFEKERGSVCAQPELSSVSELNETDNALSLASDSTLKLRPFGCMSFKRKKSFSDTEVKSNKTTEEQSENTKKQNTGQKNYKSYGKNSQSEDDVKEQAQSNSIIEDERADNCLFLATVGTRDPSVIKAALEHYSNDSSIIDAIIQDALLDKEKDRVDSSIIIDEGKKTQESCEAIENTPFVEIQKTKPVKQKSIVSKSTSDESNTEVINDTPISYVSVRKKNLLRKNVIRRNNERNVDIDDQQDKVAYQSTLERVEDFFSQRLGENQAGQVIISPTLAKKINETSSDSEDFDQCLISNNFGMNVDILANDVASIVDQVCNDFDKCTEILNRRFEQDVLNIANDIHVENAPLQEISNTIKESNVEKNTKQINKATKCKQKPLKLIYKTTPKNQKTKPKNVKNKPILQHAKMTPIIEATNEVTDESSLKNTSPETKRDEGTPLTRKRRKLYSPKDDQITAEKFNEAENFIKHPPKSVAVCSDEDDDVALSELRSLSKKIQKSKKKSKKVTPNSKATCYKETEKERQKHKKIRVRKSKTAVSPLSPKTKKLSDVFDHLKDTSDSNEKIILADKQSKDIAIYNFTSDSEDEDFEKKKIEIHKRGSTTTVDSGNSVMSLRRRTRVKNVNTSRDKEFKSEDKPSKRKRKPLKGKNTKTKTEIDIPKNLTDERMRATTSGILNTSLVIEKPIVVGNQEPDPIIIPPEIENIDDIQSEVFTVKMPTKKGMKDIRKDKEKALEASQEKDDEGTISPLPTLLVEQVHDEPHKEESLTENMVKKFQKIYKEGPDVCLHETNTTHNLLSDFERTNCSACINTIEEFNEIDDCGVESLRSEPKDNTNVSERRNRRIKEIDNPEMIAGKDHCGRNEKSPMKYNKYTLKLRNKKKATPTIKDDSISKVNTHVSIIEDIDITDVTKGSVNKAWNKLKLNNKDNTNQSHEDNSQSEKIGKTYGTSNIITSEQFNEEIICVDEQISTNNSNKLSIHQKNVYEERKAKKLKHLETINLLDSKVESENSIVTVDITAHGDSTQMPPTLNKLKERVLLPREFEDMDLSLQEYFIKLRNEINGSEKSSSKRSDKSSYGNSNTSKEKLKSSKVIIKRMSNEELSKYSSRHETSKESSKNSSDNEIRRFLPSPKDSDSEVYESALRSPVRSSNSVQDSIKTSQKVYKTRSFERQVKSKTDTNNDTSEKDNKRRSLISPIKLFDDFLVSKLNKLDEVMNLSHKTSTPVPKSVEKPKIEKEFFKKPIVNEPSSAESENNESNQIDDSRTARIVKRKSEEDKVNSNKRRKFDETQSGPSMSSVDSWLRRNVSTSSREYIDTSVRDTVQNMMEKIDTTKGSVNKAWNKLKLNNKDNTNQSHEDNSQSEKIGKTYGTSNIITSEQFNEEIICVDEQISTNNSNKLSIHQKNVYEERKAKKLKHLETINLLDSKVESENSIVTVDITAHGDSTQMPPTLNKQKERVLLPREFEDMDLSLQEYFIKLRNEINGSEKSSSKRSDKSSYGYSNTSKEKLKSSKVIIKRMSNEELSKYSSRHETSKESSKNSSDNEIRRFLPSPKDSDSEVYESALRSPVRSSNSVQDSIKTSQKVYKTRSFERQVKSKTDTNNDTSEKDNKRRSLISPIKLFDDFLVSKLNKLDEVMNLSHKTSTPVPKSVEKPKIEKEFFKKPIVNEPSSAESENNESNQIDDSRTARIVKRKSEEDKVNSNKRRKFDETQSGPSMSSVDSWLRRNVSTSSREYIDTSVRDTVQNMMEKIDTTLNEIHQNTNESFAHLFVDVQKKLEEHEKEARELKRKLGANILQAMSNLMDMFDQGLSEIDTHS